MGADDLFELMDIFVLILGVYAIYGGYVLRREGKIIRTFLVFKDTDLDSCKDLQGYANFMGPKLYALGGVMVFYGCISMLNTHVVDISSLFWIALAAFLAVLFWYGMAAKKAMKIYF